MKKKTLKHKKSMEEHVYPDKAFQPFALFRQRKEDENTRLMETLDEAVEKDYQFDKPKKDRYKELRAFLKEQKK